MICSPGDQDILMDQKSKKDFNLEDLDISSLDEDLHLDLERADHFLGHLTRLELERLIHQSGLMRSIKRAGYQDLELGVELLSPQDHRFWIQTVQGEKIYFIRLKARHYKMSGQLGARKLLSIDWVETRNIHSARAPGFPGQQKPGLGFAVMMAQKRMLAALVAAIHADGGVTVPEYFHDAIMFKNIFHFRFVNPVKAALFADLQDLMPAIRLRELSHAIHAGRVIDMVDNTVFQWSYGEMVLLNTEEDSQLVFDADFVRLVATNRVPGRFQYVS